MTLMISLEKPTNHVPEGTRPSGEGFIDDSPESPAESSASGSSVYEEFDITPQLRDSAVDGMRDYDVLDTFRARHVHNDDGAEEICDNMGDDVEAEDWELADGDFTKQYNRLRQHYEAINAGPSRMQRPIPAQNTAPSSKTKTKITGVSGNPKAQNERTNFDKSQRATTEQVLDPRTLLILSGLINRGICGKLQQCISTGKEANVYYAPLDTSENTTHLAVKIYRTSILNFRSRQAYIEGEFRFRGEYSSSRNPRKMVRLWAEKELRNLRRLEQGGIPSPRAIEVKENVLVLEYLGTPDRAAPRLKDAELASEALENAYKDLMITMRRMFQSCKLVHADLSEYNVLYFQNEPYIIDVSQSVEQDHPRALDFLRSDIKNVEAFFRKQSGGCRTMGIRGAWSFITDSDVGIHDAGDPSSALGLRGILDKRLDEPASPTLDAVFLQAFMPRGLGDIVDPERHMEDLLLQSQVSRELGPSPVREDSETEYDTGTSPSEDGDEHPATPRSRGFRHEDRDTKRARKKAVKEQNRERRKQKMPKAEKARLINKTAR